MPTEKITVSTKVSAPISIVWDAFTNPGNITQWNFASKDWCCPSAENELSVGGKYLARMEAKDGSFGFDFEGIYREITSQKSLALDLSDGRQMSTTFENEGGETAVTTVFDADQEGPTEIQRDGWQSILNNFKAHAETLK